MCLATDNIQMDKIETETCSRCGGSGRYSYCQMYGDRCFKCGGKGRTMTKRGAATNKFIAGLRSKPANELKIGDVFRVDGIPGFCGDEWVTVQSIIADPLNAGYTTIKGDKTDYSYPTAEPTIFRVKQTPEQTRETFRLGMEYQATLTKAGTPRKR